MWSTIKLKTKIIQKRLITCHCKACVSKKWSRYQKKTNPKFKLAFIAVVIAVVATSAYDKQWNPDRWTFTNEPISQVSARAQATSDTTIALPVMDGASVTGNGDKKEGKTKTTGGALSPVAPQVEVIKQVAEKEGIDWKVLYGICVKESNCNSDRVGDSGNSYGAFQIHQKYHPGTVECAKDLKCSAEWTAKRLKRFAHLGEDSMILSHNGLVGDRNGDGQVDNIYYLKDVRKIVTSL